MLPIMHDAFHHAPHFALSTAVSSGFLPRIHLGEIIPENTVKQRSPVLQLYRALEEGLAYLERCHGTSHGECEQVQSLSNTQRVSQVTLN